jgi:hypothetical protein
MNVKRFRTTINIKWLRFVLKYIFLKFCLRVEREFQGFLWIKGRF